MHLRQVHRHEIPRTDFERLAADRREVVARYLISNLRKTGDHPTLKTLWEIASSFSLTIGSAHELFGYDLEAVRRFELLVNHSRTHIVENYWFDRDTPLQVPLRLADPHVFKTNTMMENLVLEWQGPITPDSWEQE